MLLILNKTSVLLLEAPNIGHITKTNIIEEAILLSNQLNSILFSINIRMPSVAGIVATQK